MKTAKTKVTDSWLSAIMEVWDFSTVLFWWMRMNGVKVKNCREYLALKRQNPPAYLLHPICYIRAECADYSRGLKPGFGSFVE